MERKGPHFYESQSQLVDHGVAMDVVMAEDTLSQRTGNLVAEATAVPQLDDLRRLSEEIRKRRQAKKDGEK